MLRQRSCEKIVLLACSLAASVALTSVSGCGVLTNSQVNAVNRFGTATENYGTLPGTVIDAYSAARVNDNWILRAPGMVTGSNAAKARVAADANWQGLLKQRQVASGLNTEAAKADAAIGILDIYARMLIRLSSDEFTDQLDTDAVALGNQLDKGIGAYNSNFGGSLPNLGSIVAAAIRGAGGIYIRAKQEEALQDVVPKADTVIERLTSDIATLMDTFLEPKDGLLANEEANLKAAYTEAVIAAATSGGRPVSIEVASSFSAAQANIDEMRRLAQLSKQAAGTYRTAHAKLVEAIRAPLSVASAKEQIQTLADEIKAARKIKKKMDDAE